MTALRRAARGSAGFAFIALALVSCGGEKGTGPNPTQPTPAVLQEIGGSGQEGIAGTSLPIQFAVEVLSNTGMPVSGVTVVFAVTTGGGSVSPATSVTNASGQARTTFTLGHAAGTQSVTASLSPLPAVTFTATAVAGPAAQLTVVQGAPANAAVGVPLPAPIRLRVSDIRGNVVAGVPLMAATAAGSGTFAFEETVTDVAGEMSGIWTLGTVPGAQRLTVSVASQPTIAAAVLTAIGEPGPPDTVRVLAGNNQTADAGHSLPSPLTVRVADAFGNAVANRAVMFAVHSGGGTVSATTVTTDAAGHASATWVLGALVGAQSVSASVTHVDGGASTLFTATALAPSLASLWRLEHRVIDAVYAPATNRIVTVSASPQRLTIVDPDERTEHAVPLAQVPLSVSVDPTGAHAAVSHDGLLSYVNLATGVVEQTYNVPSTGGSVVLAGNGFAYLFPRSDQWVNVKRIDLATGSVISGPDMIYAGMRAKLHPSGEFIYGATTLLSPSDFVKFDIRDGAARLIYDSPYHGNFEFAGDLWIAGNGARLFARSANVFTSSPVREEDILYAGKLTGSSGVRAAVQPANNPRVYVLGTTGPLFDPHPITAMQMYEAQHLGYQGSAILPKFRVSQSGGASIGHRAEGRFLFVNAAGTRLFALVQAPSAAALTQHWGVAEFEAAALP